MTSPPRRPRAVDHAAISRHSRPSTVQASPPPGELREKIVQIVNTGLAIAEETDDTDPAARDYLIDAILSAIGAVPGGEGES